MQIRILEETKIVESNGWIARIRPPTEKWNGRVVLLLHGWTGDENIMWIFARKIPTNCWMIAPRGPLNSTEGGYAWAVPQNAERPDISQFTRHSKQLVERLAEWIPDYSNKSRLDIVGFSQGAAMTYCMCLETKPIKVAPLAGYLPPGYEEQLKDRDLTGLQMFIAHNSDDAVVSSEESQKAASYFSKHGATVHYCDSTGGHKISSSCFNGLDKFLEN